MTRKQLDPKNIKDQEKQNKIKTFFQDQQKVVKYSIIGLLALVLTLTLGAISSSLRNKDKNNGKAKIETSKETQKETQKETKLEVSKELEEKINAEIEEEIKEIENKGLSKEDQEKEIQKTKENILNKVSQKEKLDKKSLANIVNKKVSTRVESSSKLDKTIKTNAKEEIKEIERKESNQNKAIKHT